MQTKPNMKLFTTLGRFPAGSPPTPAGRFAAAAIAPGGGGYMALASAAVAYGPAAAFAAIACEIAACCIIGIEHSPPGGTPRGYPAGSAIVAITC